MMSSDSVTVGREEQRGADARGVEGLLVLSLAFAACAPASAPQRYGYLALLGRDTISVESVTRTGDELVSDEVDRFPRVRRRHTAITLDHDGGIRHLEMDIR